MAVNHEPPARFNPGDTLTITFTTPIEMTEARLHYRHVDQAETWQALPMALQASGWQATIPGPYTASPFALQYYFELRDNGVASLSPGLASDLANQPYYLLRQA
jgi:hypothetical protein